jgi:hypothetical protein
VLKKVLVMISLAACACVHAQHRNDWRNPPRACTAEEPCPDGTCAIPMGASEGTCSGATLPPLPPHEVDGGARPSGPPSTIQPSSTDIHI